MAGHSKWANIKHRKDAVDKKRGKTWTKILREVTVASRSGGPDPSANPRLRLVMDKANSQNVPKDTVERAIKRGAGEEGSDNYEEIRYEGYGPGGVAVMVDCMTDNRNRTAADVRHAFTKYGGNLGANGAVSYLFTKRGVIGFAPGADEDLVMEAAVEAGAEDVVTHEDGWIEVFADPDLFSDVKDAILAAGLTPEEAEVTYKASTDAVLDDQDLAERMMKMLDLLEDLDDVQDVYHNAEIPDAILEALG